MHDPLSVAWEIKRPWPHRSMLGDRPWNYYPPVVTVWHRDPEVWGDDDSCMTARRIQLRLQQSGYIEADGGTLRIYAGSSWAMRHLPWRWHVWHYRLQFPPVQMLKRWIFSRCATCGQRFSFGYCPVSTSWNGTGPRWFRPEPHVHHSECRQASQKMVEPA